MLSGSVYIIPTGRQLPRTPPVKEVKKLILKYDNVAMHQRTEGDSRDHPDPPTTKLNTPGTKQGFSDFSEALLTGMKGYKLTAGDLDFMKKMQAEKQTKQLQGELERVQNVIQSERMALELTLASREKIQDALENLPPYSELVEHLKQVLGIVLPSVKVAEQDIRSLLAMVTKEDVARLLSQKEQAICHLEKKRQRKEHTKAHLEYKLVDDQLVIQQLMRELSELKSRAQLQIVRRKVETKKELPRNRNSARKDTSKSTNKAQKSPSKSTVSKTPEAAAILQPLPDESKPVRVAQGRRKAVRHPKDEAESVKELDNSKKARHTGGRLHKQQEENIVPRRSKRIANRR
ncbi:uncharacterized protein LOC133494347 isoform X1 [Syngnathoides biaculeatus]|uniref:uncharacterized protein LOC133494347 isoform X1 n=1 Tax=Syngnathoides biaculeatus TaxID=300417 RepID=UPI002ADD7BF0|nr:uncharacterized protein LOC133494347 isoform X1 [Syngnathoides biaculeatus]